MKKKMTQIINSIIPYVLVAIVLGNLWIIFYPVYVEIKYEIQQRNRKDLSDPKAEKRD